MNDSFNTCPLCGNAFNHPEARICPDCCENYLIDKIIAAASRCKTCKENLATVEANDELFCDDHSPGGFTAIDLLVRKGQADTDDTGLLSIVPSFDNVFWLLHDLMSNYKNYKIACLRIFESLEKGYHLSSSKKITSPMALYFYVFFPLWIKDMIKSKQFDDAQYVLNFITGSDLGKFDIYSRHSTEIPILHSLVLQHYGKFGQARAILEGELRTLIDDAFYEGALDSEDINEDFDFLMNNVKSFLNELYDCGRREDRVEIMKELESAGSMINLKTREDDLAVLERTADSPDDQLRKFQQFHLGDNEIDRYIKKCSAKYKAKSDFLIECWNMLEYLYGRLRDKGISLYFNQDEKADNLRKGYPAFVHANTIRIMRNQRAHHQPYENEVQNLIVLCHMNCVLDFCKKILD